MIATGNSHVPQEKIDIMRKVLSTLNDFLEDKIWFAGENVTIADLSILSNLIVILVRPSS